MGDTGDMREGKSEGDKRKILFLAPSLRGGGSERFLTILLKYIDRSKFIPVLALVQKEGVFLSELPGDIEVVDLDAGRVRYAILKIIRIVRQEEPDVIFSTLGHVNIGVMLARLLLSGDIRYIARETNIQSINEKRPFLTPILHLMYRVLYPRFDFVICQSFDMLNDLVNYFGLPPKKAVVINNAVDIKRINSQICNGGIYFKSGRVNLLAVGKLRYQKGFDLLLQSLALLKGTDFHLTILGQGPEEENLKLVALELGLREHVTFTGFVQNPYPYMSQADLFVLSSRFEGFPNVVLEAMACGTPVVAFECPGGISEIIEEGVNGWKVNPGDTSALASAIEKAVKTPLDSNLIRKSVQERFGVEKMVREYESIFSKNTEVLI